MYLIKFNYETLPNMFVSGFSSAHLCVQMGDHSYAKRFKSQKLAQNFIDKYSDAGYGMGSKDVEIVAEGVN